MGILRDDIRPGAGPPPSGAGPEAQPPEPAPDGATADEAQLRRRCVTLAEQVTELHWDLGGLAYEMAIRDHFRLDVLVRRAAVLQERDAELAEVERLLRMQGAGIAGHCPHCAAPHSRGAMFCWQCGAALMERAPSSALTQGAAGPGADHAAVMEALLPPADPGADSGYGPGE